MHKLLVVLFAFALVACDVTQPVAPTPGDANNDVNSIVQIDINIDNNRNDGDETQKRENRAPIITLPSNLENFAGDSVVLIVSVFDPDNDNFACTNFQGPRGLSISSDCVVTGDISSSSAGEVFTTIVEASDGRDTGRGTTSWNVLEPVE